MDLNENTASTTAEASYCYLNRWGSFDCILCGIPFSNKGLYEEHASKSEEHKEKAKQKGAKGKKAQCKGVVFISAMEHNSNILPWRESGLKIVTIPVDSLTGELDYQKLEGELTAHEDYEIKIGSFTACSNITGICTDVDYLSYLLHKHHALAFFDYAAGGPYLKIDMNAPLEKCKVPGGDAAEFMKLAYKDAVFLSGHKFLGGPGSPGILVAKRTLFTKSVPAMPGGGTIFYIASDEHVYAASIETREEGGTPDIIGAIRAGLSFQLKDAIGESEMLKRNLRLVEAFYSRLSKSPNVLLLLPALSPRQLVPIFSFNIKSHHKLLHYNFVAKLLNDVFGIQSRGGCSCAGIYGQQLLDAAGGLAKTYNQIVGKGYEVLRLGYVRLQLSWHASEE